MALVDWINASIAGIALTVAIYAVIREETRSKRLERDQHKQAQELAEMRRTKITGHIVGSRSHPIRDTRTFTQLDVIVRLINEGFAEDSVKSASVKFPDWIEMSLHHMRRAEKTGGLNELILQPAEHAPYYFQFTVDGPYTLDFKKGILKVEFVRGSPLELDLQVAMPGLPESTGIP